MFTLHNVTFLVLQKGQDISEMGKWTYLTILVQDNRRTNIFTMYRPSKGSISFTRDSIVIKQQWLVIQQIKRKDHPHKAAIIDIIITINK